MPFETGSTYIADVAGASSPVANRSFLRRDIQRIIMGSLEHFTDAFGQSGV